jgi:stage II sporulation protein D
MKKIIFVILLIIIIPYLVVTLFIKEDEINFSYVMNNNVKVKREKTGKIEEIPFEDYIVGVLAGEMPSSFPEEALKAQAVAARSYVLKKIENNNGKEYDVYDSIKDQVYLDEEILKKNWGNKYIENINKIKKAVLDTKGEYLTYDNKVISAFFFSTSNGKTENCEEVFQEKLPYLKSVDSSWDSDVSPVYNDEKIISLKEFYNKLNLEYNENLQIKVIDYTESGSIKSIEINDKKFKGTDIRFKLGLRSTYFTIKKVNENVNIITKGNGHGVGMSQYGAYAMAKLGYDYSQILKYYYTNVEIKKI